MCTCSERANILYLLFFAAPTGQTVGTADAKLAAGCACQGRQSSFARDPSVLGNFDLLTPNLVHLWNSMSVIRWYMSFRDRVHSAHAMHVHYVYA